MPEIRAPGKLVLGGEYAVVYGGVALAVPAAEGLAAWQDGAGVVLRPFGLEAELAGTKLVWQAPNSVTERFDRIWDHCVAAFGLQAGDFGQRLCIDTSAFVARDGRKWGFGSSGVSLWLAVRALAALAGKPAQAWECLQAFRQAEGEQGSGIDVAVAHSGHAVLHTLSESLTARIRDVPVYAVQLPAAQSTEGTLQKLDGDSFPRSLMDQARLLATSWEASSWQDWLAQLHAYDRALDTWLAPSGLARLPAVAALQEQLGADWYVRPCGAGGDSALLLPSAGGAAELPNLKNEVMSLRI